MTARTVDGLKLTPGVNSDPIDVPAGVAKARQLGYSLWRHQMEVEYNLARWARGEEADHSMSTSLSGVSYTDWRVILAAARAAGEARKDERS